MRQQETCTPEVRLDAGRSWLRTGIVLCALLGLLVGSTAWAATATVTTDKKLYSVGEGMVIRGAGFSPNVMIKLSVQRPDKLIDIVAGVTTDGLGNFTANYAPPMEPGRYDITATDGVVSAKSATTEADAIGYNKGVYKKGSTAPDDSTGTWTTGNAGSRIVAMSFCEPRSWTRVLSS